MYQTIVGDKMPKPYKLPCKMQYSHIFNVQIKNPPFLMLLYMAQRSDHADNTGKEFADCLAKKGNVLGTDGLKIYLKIGSISPAFSINILIFLHKRMSSMRG